MKKTFQYITFLILALVIILCTVSCAGNIDTEAVWESATYISDTTVGNGANTVKVEITAGEKTIILTLRTDKATLGEAMLEHDLVNDATFFDTCNGIKADWNKDNAYWSFFVGDKRAEYGIGDALAATAGEPTYKLIYTK